ncbi:hypothetical protein THUN1379_26600 [Paludibacterium sp. THUN1379]|uniref:hypothetical protein n=1 Tax=Paludibacterium sp. THUN1379 TaxID=3112107 RepID=UPI00308CA0B3|nr:hypothetical protein THUN1379_26600 [Paludibacterium sp. THUN1379]
MNPVPATFPVFHWLAEQLQTPDWQARSLILQGQLGEQCLRARQFAHGLAVAISVDRPPSQCRAACLLLAATPEACDDALYLAEGKLWLWRRFAPALTLAEFDLLFKQQQIMVQLLAWRISRVEPVSRTWGGRL